ncbi:GrpB family protein [Thalassotalea ponticola]|uniref:GrpB family protein n=1 Tax=Thalassotalea ponticola TaxID=1523392 RepID=UPI0025B56BD3|nr:GrpB family protein [Thalassotalea ponticola]MDN3652522.1 GrpB family protein [Thalassotalea ponticola]
MYLYPYKAEWRSEFEKERSLILANYAGEIDIFHIGSTAIDGLYAKDCIDILGVVKDISLVPSLSRKFIDIGYVSKGAYGIKGREYFSKKVRKVHFHIFQSGDAAIEKHLTFVKVMRDNLELIAELNQIKKELHSKYPNDKDAYQQEKAFFYSRIGKVL